jgi:hypothetical protein
MSVVANKNEGSLQNQPLLPFFLADVDQQSSEIGEVVIDIPQSAIEYCFLEWKEPSFFFQDPVVIYMDLKWSRNPSVFNFLKTKFRSFKYDLQACLLLYFSILIISFVLKDGSLVQLVNQFLAWLSWKFVYT